MSESRPTEERVIKPRSGLIPIDFPELWRYRELLWMLAWRNILIRYKQTYIGIAWAVIQPLLIVVVFSMIFGKLAKLPDGGAAYPVLTLAAVLPWQFFANALSESSNSLVASQAMISKIYFPRLLIPLSSVLSGTLDFLVSIGLLGIVMLWYQVPFTANLLLLPFFFIVAFGAALAVGVWFSALNVKYRDVKYVVPFIVRMGLYISPVGFLTSSLIPNLIKPDQLLWYYCLNPMAGVIDGFRWAILGQSFAPLWTGFWLSVGVIPIILIPGLYYFRSTEKTFADVI